jgi:hypothetical protein
MFFVPQFGIVSIGSPTFVNKYVVYGVVHKWRHGLREKGYQGFLMTVLKPQFYKACKGCVCQKLSKMMNPIWIFFWCATFGYLYFLFQSLNEPWLGAKIDPGMALTPFPSSIGWHLNPRPSNFEQSLLTTKPDFRPRTLYIVQTKRFKQT